MWQTHLAARLSRGTLAGEHYGTPSAVIVVASEDDWPRTVAPRLVAAGADLALVYRLEVATADDLPGSLTLPLDVERLERAVRKVAAAAVFLDPLVTVLDGSLDAHRDREVRGALEPLAQLAHRTGTLVNGLVHLGKSDRADVATAVLGSRAFTAVSRAVLVAARDPDAEDGACVLSVEKANLGRLDVPGLRYRIDSASVPTPEGPADVGRLVLLGESDRQVRDFYADHADADERSDRDEAVDWLRGHLIETGGEAAAADLFRAASAAGISKRTLQRARPRAGVRADRRGFRRAPSGGCTHLRRDRDDATQCLGCRGGTARAVPFFGSPAVGPLPCPRFSPHPPRNKRASAMEGPEVSRAAPNLPPPPDGAGPAGRALWRAVIAAYELEEHEAVLLKEAVRTTDQLDQLAELVERDGPVVASSQGPRAHPALVEGRQQRLLLARLLRSLRLPTGEQEDPAVEPRPRRRGGPRSAA